MFILQINKKIILSLIVIACFFNGFAQMNIQSDTILYDSLFKQAKYYAYNGERQKAINTCRVLLAKDYNSDVDVLLGRIYSWTDKYDSSKIILNNVLAIKPGHYDAYEALIDLEYWNNKYEDAMKVCEEALIDHPDDEMFLFKQAKIFKAQNKNSEAITTLQKIIAIDTTNQDAIKLLSSLKK